MNEASEGVTMADVPNIGRESISLNTPTEVQQQQQQDGGQHHNQQQPGIPLQVGEADLGLQRMELEKSVSLLASIFDQIYAKP